MKRTYKNILMLIILLIIITSIGLTIYYGSKSINANTLAPDMGSFSGELNTPPDMNSDAKFEKGDMPSMEDGTALEKPDGDKMTDNNMDDNINNFEGNMPNNMDTNSQSLAITYYILFGVESLLLSITIMYLILSSFNKKTLKETFNSGDKVLILILSIIILTPALMFAEVMGVKNININTNSSNINDISNSSSDVSYSSLNEINEDTTISSGDYTSDNSDENALLIKGNIAVTLENISVSKTGDSDGGDNTSFYGNNSAILACEKANVVIRDITVTTNATGANGVFAYGGYASTNNTSSDGTTITISNSEITTYKDNSGGIMVTGGGIINANNLTVTTSGISSAAIRSDRGGGVITVDEGTYKTTGAGSPTIYSTADITVKNANLIATSAEGIIIEGKNSVTIESSILTDSNTKLNGQSTTYKNIFLYQSVSGDASEGTSEFTAKNSTITTNNGDFLYVTNTSAIINLENNTFIHNDANGYFLRIQKDSWGSSGSNGGKVTLNLTNQNAEGRIYVDEISSLEMNLTTANYEGSLNSENIDTDITLTLDSSSTLKLTSDTYITTLNNEDSTNGNIDFNGYKLYVNGVAIN